MEGSRRNSECCGYLRSMFGHAKDVFHKANDECKDACNCFKCCFGCAWGFLQLWTPLSASFIIYWLIYRPDHFHPHMDSAVLTTFDLTITSGTTTALRYDLTVDLSFRNSHLLAMRYLDIATFVFYNGTKLGPTDDVLQSFVQAPKITTVLHPKFNGLVTVDSDVAAEVQKERAAAMLHLRVTVSLALSYKVLFVQDVFFNQYDCWLWFPPPSNHTPALFNGDGTKYWRI